MICQDMSIARRTRLYHKLQLAAHRVQKSGDLTVRAASGLTTAQASVLSIIATLPKASQKDVANQLGLNESAVTAMVSRLISDNLVSRERDTADKRSWLLSLTSHGEEKLSAVAAPFSDINGKMETCLSEQEVRTLAELLQRLSDSFEG